MRTCRNCGKTLPNNNIKFCVSCGSASIFDSDTMVSEYKRTCNQCGTVWHSLQTREDALKNEITNYNNRSGSSECCMCAQNKPTKSTAEVKTCASELERLKICPKCNSGNIREEVLVYDKK